ncbi:Serine/threonine protein kinase [Spraguea lophii 42_110]|uniref:Serine/threonine protein kinase n=1 Tax=Spraguea lophii (strain 42_110) TaxID=1358809 RepID=S7XGU8_SPRLO|nr:Serine/threonine protein kinase [Spraguea lophii 42_110]
MVSFLNLFMIFTALNYVVFVQNIKATNNNPLKKETKKILTLENIREKKYEINGKILVRSSSYSTCEEKCVKITEIEYDGIEIQFMDKDCLHIKIKESEFHSIMNGDLKLNDRDYYFKIISVVFKVTAFIEEKCFHTTLWYDCPSDPLKIYTSLHDQLPKSIHCFGSNPFYKYILLMLPPNCFGNTAYSNSGYLGNQNIYNVDVLKAKKIDVYMFVNLAIDKTSNAYNINEFMFDHVYSELYTKIYYETNDHGMVEGYIGKNTNQCNMNENILVSYTKIIKSQDKNSRNKIQNKNNLKNQSAPENTPIITKISYNTQKDEVENPNPDLTNKCQYCQKNIEDRQAKLNNSDTENTIIKIQNIQTII